MIGVLSIGRLGNQLFQYAFALELSQHLRTEFFIKDENKLHKFYADRYFKLAHFNRSINAIRSIRYRNFGMLRINGAKSPSENIQGCKNGFLYHGFYQSAKYFASFREQIKSCIQVRDKHVKEFTKNYHDYFQNKNLVIHVRGTDYKDSTSMVLSRDYYWEALNQIDRLDKYKIWLVTDDINHARTILPQNLDYSYSQGSEVDDFQIIANSDVAIIANSSFSWWAAYLNTRKNNKVYAPKRWLGTQDAQYPNSVLADTGFSEI